MCGGPPVPANRDPNARKDQVQKSLEFYKEAWTDRTLGTRQT
jgi:hypothetical protein